MTENNIDKDIVIQLAHSRKDGFEGYSILYCKQHPTTILSGRHRGRAGWASQEFRDVEEYAKTQNLPHEAAHEILRDKLNITRRVSQEERAASINKVAKLLTVEQNHPKQGISARLHELYPYFSERYIQELLLPEFKDQKKAEAGRLGGLESARDKSGELSSAELTFEPTIEPKTGRIPETEIIAPSPVKEPFAKGLSPEAGSMTQTAFTPPAQRWQRLLKEAGRKDAIFEHAFTNEETDITYHADVFDKLAGVIFEAEGEGSNSKDNPKRDAFLQSQGYPVIHLDNDFLMSPYAPKVAEAFAEVLASNGRERTRDTDETVSCAACGNVVPIEERLVQHWKRYLKPHRSGLGNACGTGGRPLDY